MKKMYLRLLILISIVSVLSSCNGRVDKNLGVKFVDEAKLYSEKFKEEIVNGKYHFPNGVPVLILTVDSIPISEIGFYASTVLENSSKWIESKKERKNCVLLIISKNPKLIQMRFGENVLLESYKSGLSAGNKYRTYQESFIAKDYESGLNEVLKNLEIELPQALDISWIMKLQKTGAKIAFKEMSDLSMPSDGAYTNNIFKPYCRLINTVSLFSSPFFLVLINALLLLLIVKVGKFIIKRLFGTRRLIKITAVLLVIWGIVSSVFFSIPFWGSFVFLSSMRIEDSLFAQYLQIPLLNISNNSFWFSSFTQFWLAIIVGVIVFAVTLPNGALNIMGVSYLFSSSKEEYESDIKNDLSENSGLIFDQALGSGFRFTFLALFMPRAISLLILVYYILKIPSAIKGYFQWDKATN
jgi:hypothetical protein